MPTAAYKWRKISFERDTDGRLQSSAGAFAGLSLKGNL